MKKLKKLNLIQRLLLAILLGIIVGQLTILPTLFFELMMTLSSLFGTILNFILPLMVIGFIVGGITRLSVNAGKLLGLTMGLSFGSLLFAAAIAFVVGQAIFPIFITEVDPNLFSDAAGIQPLFELQLAPFFTVAEATLFSFIFGIALSVLQREKKGATLRQVFLDLQQVILKVLNGFIIPLLPLYVFGNFMNLSYSGSVFEVFRLFAPVYILIILMHIGYLVVMYFTGSRFSEKSLGDMIKNVLPAYLTAFGTQSSATSIPISIKSGKANAIDNEIAEFMFPLTATIHLPGSMIATSSLILAVVMIVGGDSSAAAMFPFYMTLALALVAAPGVPGGAIMTAIPYLGMVGLPTEGAITALLITLYLAQDSFGTATNVSSDQGIAPIVQRYYDKIFGKEVLPEGEASKDVKI